MENRERMFFGNTDMTTFKFAGMNTLSILHRLPSTEGIHGRHVQRMLSQVFDGAWTSGNDVLYTMLDAFEREGYISSQWAACDDRNKKSYRYYHITDKGIEYLSSVRGTFMNDLDKIQKVWDWTLKTVWDDVQPQTETARNVVFSSSLLTTLLLLNFFYRAQQSLILPKKHVVDNEQTTAEINPTSSTRKWFYASEIKEALYHASNKIWAPSDGVLYPKLSMLDTQGYLESRWADNGEEAFTKKRSVRQYSITPKGEDYLLFLTSPASGLKNKIVALRSVAEKSADLVSGSTVASLQEIKRQIV